jgi:hypothetical protein
VTPCSVALAYQCFGGSLCLHLQAVRCYETLVSYLNTMWRPNLEHFDLNNKAFKYFTSISITPSTFQNAKNLDMELTLFSVASWT